MSRQAAELKGWLPVPRQTHKTRWLGQSLSDAPATVFAVIKSDKCQTANAVSSLSLPQSSASGMPPEGAIPRAELLSGPDEARWFRWLRRRIGANQLRVAFRQSRLRLFLVALLTGILWIALFQLFAEGFQFLNVMIPDQVTHDDTARAVFSIFFASLTVMLVFSTGIILYGGLFRSSEVEFLFSLPVRAERIFLHKFQEAMLFSSWGFLLLGTPMLVAYGSVEHSGWYYFAVLLPFLVGFAYIPGGLGAIAALIIVRWLPRRKIRSLAIAAATAASVGAVAAVVAWRGSRGAESDLLTPGWFQEMLDRIRFSEARLLPSWWLSSGLLEAAKAGWDAEGRRAATTESFKFLSLTVANALSLHQIAVWLSGHLYRAGYQSLHSDLSGSRRPRASLLDRLVERRAFFLTPQMRLLIVKDLRLFRRDPVQWLQFLIFFGLLALYFLNIRRLSYDVNYANWVNMISFLNLSVVGLILSTFTTRFIFPMISLEGRRFWILGLLPVRRETILLGKFLFAAVGSLIPSTLLVLLSDSMLRVSPLVLLVHVLACVMFCAGLSGIAVGLGAKMPNLRDDSPSRIAAGFGGTLNLILSTAYVAAIVAMTAVPCHFYLAADSLNAVGRLPHERLGQLMALGAVGSVVLGLIATVVPLRMGCKAFRELEF
jgi:ABC-2 type transport system permease protein